MPKLLLSSERLADRALGRGRWFAADLIVNGDAVTGLSHGRQGC
ncbi:MAG TPA: hypothetical protein VGQ89_01705 [Candidatus Limnocylindrales bacterium]|nr:hypothetical protein [Candidatus Limnocylindrales bacterium]